MGVKPETSGYFGSGQTWTLTHADPSGTFGVAGKPIESPQRSSQSNTSYYMLNDERTIEKRSYQVGGVVAGDVNDDSRYAEWQHVNGAIVPTRVAIGIPSELFSAYNITLDADRASSAATNHALQLGATDLEYEVTRVKSPVLGRDLNPFGRGDGTYYCNGASNVTGSYIAIRDAKEPYEGVISGGYGNSVNNSDNDDGCGPAATTDPETDVGCQKRIEELERAIADINFYIARNTKRIEEMLERVEELNDELADLRWEAMQVTILFTAGALHLWRALLFCLMACLFLGPAAGLCVWLCWMAYILLMAALIVWWGMTMWSIWRRMMEVEAEIRDLRAKIQRLRWENQHLREEKSKLTEKLAKVRKQCERKPVEPETMPATMPGGVLALTVAFERRSGYRNIPGRRTWKVA